MTGTTAHDERRTLRLPSGRGATGRWLRESEPGLLSLALLVGAGAGLGRWPSAT